MSAFAIEIESLWKLYALQHSGASQKIKLAGPLVSREDEAVRDGKAFWALRDVNLTISRGEVVGLIGPNGAGKSTLLKILSRVTAPTRGRVRIHGALVSLLEVGTGFHQELTGRENIALNATILGMTSAELKNSFDDIVEFSGIGSFIDMPVKYLSSGMRVRLGFSVAVHLEPEILIIDEVLSVGDADFQERCRERVAALVGSRERTVLVVSHSMGDISTLCSRVLRIEKGAIIADGPPEEVIREYMSGARKSIHVDHIAISPSNNKPNEASSVALEKKQAATPIIDDNRLWHLHERQDRSGDGRITFTSLSFFDADGNAVESIGAGQTLEIELAYTALARATGRQKCSVSIAVTNDRGGRVFWLPSRIVFDEVQTIEENGSFYCRIPELPLLPGNYLLDIWCLLDGIMTDKIRHAAMLSVVASDYYPTRQFPSTRNGDTLVRFEWSDRKPAKKNLRREDLG
jgi:lipopolysaccharide transport system ATP-binding protein